MYAYFLFLALFEVIIVNIVLDNRGIGLNNMEKLAVFLVISIMIQYCIVVCMDFYYLLRIIFSIPILFIVSYTDTKFRLVFDEDLICGIIVQVGIVLTFIIIDIVYIKKYSPIGLNCTFTEKIASLYGKIEKGIFNKGELGIYFDHLSYLFEDIKRNIYGSIALFLVSYVIAKSTEAMGMGDVLYFSFIASFTDVSISFFIFFASFIFSGLYCIFLRIFDKKSFFNGLISFTPFISVGFLISLCL